MILFDGKQYNSIEEIQNQNLKKLNEFVAANMDPKVSEKLVNNQSVKADAGKPKLSLVPRQIIYDIAAIREYGNNKYPNGGKDNWKNVEPERYKDAAFRHFLAYLDDPHGVDFESGLPHLWHLACNIAFLCALEDDEIINKNHIL